MGVVHSRQGFGAASKHHRTHDRPQCLVVMYHYVRDEAPSMTLGGSVETSGVRGLTAKAFSAQIDELSRSMEPIDWPSLYAGMRDAAPLPDRSFLLTFDDGLKDHVETVLPILTRRGLRGVFFVPGAVLTSQRMLSAHAIHLLLSALSEAALERQLIAVLDETGHGAVWLEKVDIFFEDAAARAMYHYESVERARLKYLLTAVLPPGLRDSAVAELFRRHVGSPTRWATHFYLGWDDLVELQSLGHTIGGHGDAHEPLDRLTPDQCRRDLRSVASVLDSGLGPDLRPLSYPYGAFNDEVSRACRDAGFVHAFTTQRAWLTPDHDRFRLPRVDTIDVAETLQEEAICSQV